MDSQPIERRQFSRVTFDAVVTVSQEDQNFTAQLVDISLNGVLIATPSEYELRTDRPCSIGVRLSQDVNIAMQVSLVHSSSQTLGFHCTSIDMDSMTHLRRLVEINLPGESASERVLNELLKRHKVG